MRRVRWDPAKAESNRQKHGITFDEAQTIFFDPQIVSVHDDDHSDMEDRYFAIGESSRRRLIALAYTIRNHEPWLISAREAEPFERRLYMKGDRIKDEATSKPVDSEHLDWSQAVRGRHHIEPRGPITVQIEPVLAEFFRDETAVNDALRMLISEGRVGMWHRQ